MVNIQCLLKTLSQASLLGIVVFSGIDFLHQPVFAESQTERTVNAYYNAGNGYCDAQMLATVWQTNPYNAKITAGKMILGYSGYPGNVPAKLSALRREYAGRGICNYSSDFSYEDAVALAAYWKTSIATAKASLTSKLESGNLKLAKQVVSEARQSVKNVNFPSDRKIFNAYFHAGYGYCDAQMLGAFWNISPENAKLLAGKGLLGLPGFSRNVPGKLVAARQQYAGRGICNYSSDFSYEDAVALAAYWNTSVSIAKASLTSKLESGNLKLARTAIGQAHRAAKKSTQIKPVSAQELTGTYENHLYDRSGKNNWHYVTIAEIDSTRLKWTNREGVSWTLTLTADQNSLSVGRDCPYYASGYRTATVQRNSNGRVTAILGPGNEPYQRQ